MTADNAQQIADWNGAVGASNGRACSATWTAWSCPFGDAALKAAAPQAGERVIDIGCGCDDTSITLAGNDSTWRFHLARRHAPPDGHVRLTGSTWVVSASNPR